MATFKHISFKNADYGAAEQYLTFEHDEFTMKPTLDETGLTDKKDFRLTTGYGEIEMTEKLIKITTKRNEYFEKKEF